VADTLFTDGQVAALATVLASGFLAIAGAIKWSVGRLVGAIDNGTADSKLTRESVVKLESAVLEGRADIAELKRLAVEFLAPRVEEEPAAPPRRTKTRMATSPGSAGHRRASTDSDR
jgi:hypothetical protein